MKKILLSLLLLLSLVGCSSNDNEPVQEIKENPQETVTTKEDKELSSFSITFLDVGNGDAMVIECDDEYMLLDGGKPSKSNLIYSYLKRNNIDKLKYVACTHPDSDHIGGLSGGLHYATAENILIHADNYSEIAEFDDLVNSIDKDKTNIIVASQGEHYKLGSCDMEVVAPKNSYDGDNNNSMVLKLTYGDITLLLMGDAEVEEEQEIINKGIKADLLKIAHHGSKSSTSDSFLDTVSPSIAIISAGENSYGHPHQVTLDKLKNRNITLYRTDLQSDIKCISNGKDIACTPSKNTSLDVYVNSNETKEEATQQEVVKQEVVKETQQSSQDQTQFKYIGNSSTKKFHLPGCSSVKQMKEANKIYFTESRDEIISKGYTPCKKCNP